MLVTYIAQTQSIIENVVNSAKYWQGLPLSLPEFSFKGTKNAYTYKVANMEITKNQIYTRRPLDIYEKS